MSETSTKVNLRFEFDEEGRIEGVLERDGQRIEFSNQRSVGVEDLHPMERVGSWEFARRPMEIAECLGRVSLEFGKRPMEIAECLEEVAGQSTGPYQVVLTLDEEES